MGEPPSPLLLDAVKPIAIDLYSGCGGLTEGLKQAGFRVIGAVEIDILAVETYQVNHPAVRVWPKDIREVDPWAMMDWFGLKPGDLDLLAGCPPCQGFSSIRTMNRGRKIEDERNDLVFDYMRFVRAMLPKAIMMENVPDLALDARMDHILTELGELGYYAERDAVRVLNAADYGVPQRRRRMILMTGYRAAMPFATPDANRRTVKQALTGLLPAGKSGDPLHDFPERRGERVTAMIRKIRKDGGGRGDLPDEDQIPCHKGFGGFKDVFGRMWWNDVSPTITGGCVNPSKGRFLHLEENRSITLREAALLQTFPRGYYFSLRRGKMNAATMIGNALPPEFIRRHADDIRKHLHSTSGASQ